MRLAVIADIHANLPALSSVLDDIHTQGVDGIILAGDLVTGGPARKQVLDLVRENVDWIIIGNADKRLLDLAHSEVSVGWRTLEQWAALRWTCEQLSFEEFEMLGSFHESLVIDAEKDTQVRVVHGSTRSLEEHIFPVGDPNLLALFDQAGLLNNQKINADQVMGLFAESLLICGHSHIPWQYEENGRLVLNPGSVGAPVDGDIRAHYMILQKKVSGWQSSLRLIDYDLNWQRRLYRESGFLYEGGAMAWIFLQSTETGSNVLGDFIQCVRRTALSAGWLDDQFYPDHIWGLAVESYDWSLEF
jgi:putative phosphoesterase